MEAKVSVIVPVYNTEAFLPRCLDSLAAQSLREIEILLLENGSADRSAALCREYAGRDRRFRVIPLEQAGVSAARNRGLEEAAADYVMFVDSDDWVEPDFCETPLRLARERNADLVFFCFQRMRENGEPAAAPRSLREGPIDRKTALDLVFGSAGCYLWNKLWRRSLFDGIRFPEGRCYEDVGTSYRPILRAERIFALDRVLYHYRQRAGSVVSQRSAACMEDYFVMHTERYEALLQWGYDPELLLARRCSMCLTCALRRKEDPAEPASVLSRRFLREQKRIPQSIRSSHRLMMLLLRRCPPLFELICRLLRKRKT